MAKTAMRLAFERAKVTRDALHSPLVDTCVRVMSLQDRRQAAARRERAKAKARASAAAEAAAGV